MSKPTDPQTAYRRGERLLLLYDGECNLCLATVEKLRRLKLRAQLEMVPYQSVPLNQLPTGVEPERLQAELHLIDEAGLVYRGAASVTRILQALPALAWLTPLYRVPGLRQLADGAYRLVARHRYRIFGRTGLESCEAGACRLPRPNEPIAPHGSPLSNDPKGEHRHED